MRIGLRYAVAVESAEQTSKNESRVGLCTNCVHARCIESARGSQFFLCQLSLSDPHFAKYPRLPVLSCQGYKSSGAR
jgi:hypothetical protein